MGEGISEGVHEFFGEVCVDQIGVHRAFLDDGGGLGKFGAKFISIGFFIS